MTTITQPRIYFSCTENPAELRGLRTEEATIIEAYFGRYPTPGPFSTRTPLGLNVQIKYATGASSGITLAKQPDIEAFMDDYKVNRPEELAGRRAWAASPEGSTRLVGLLTSLDERATQSFEDEIENGRLALIAGRT